MPSSTVCESCVKTGAQWVHLRTCQTVRRDAVLRLVAESPRQQTRQDTGHPVIASAEPGERWLYCYPDDAFAEVLTGTGREGRRGHGGRL